MDKLFFDIETIQCDDTMKELFLSARKRGMDPEMTAEDIEKLYMETSFDGTWGRICCIAYIRENHTLEKGILRGDEKELLQRFWEIARDTELFIGHNVLTFDLPFVFKRSIIHSIKPRQIPMVKFRFSPVFDTMAYWTNWGRGVGLNTLAKVFGFPSSKDEMDGSMVWPYYQQSRLDDICTYCMKDVELTRKVYYRMLLEDIPFENS